MKIYAFLALLLSSQAFAGNSQIRVCNVTEGTFHVYDFPNTGDFAADQYGFCYFGKAAIDTISLWQVTSGEEKSMALMAFERTKVVPVQNCGEASDQMGIDPEGQRIEVCLFEDASIIELKTLISGYLAPENAAFVKAIETRF